MNRDKQPEALQIASRIKHEYPYVSDFLVSLHAENEQIKKAARKAYNRWAYAEDTCGEVTAAMNELAEVLK